MLKSNGFSPLWHIFKISQEFKNEAEFQTYFWQQCKKFWYVYYKLSDFDNMSLKPCDCIVTDKDWDTHRVELKYTKTDKINTNKLEPQQLAYLTRVEENWGSAQILTYSLSKKSFIQCSLGDFLEHSNNEWTVNLFWRKLKDINRKKKVEKKFDPTKVKNNIPL